MLNMSLTGINSGLAGTTDQPQHPKNLPVCQELLTTVEQFKTFLNEQKKIREDLGNLSSSPLVKLKDDLASLLHDVSSVTSGLRRISVQCSRLKEDTLKEEKNLGMVQSLSDKTTGLHFESGATKNYFMIKLTEFDNLVKLYKKEMDNLEHLINSQSSSTLTPKDLVNLLRRMDDEFISLASQLYTLYDQIRVLKSRYIRNQRALTGEAGNPFAEVEASSLKLRQLEGSLGGNALATGKKLPTLKSHYGPSPFSGIPISAVTFGQTPNLLAPTQPSVLPFASTVNQQPNTAFGSCGLGTGSILFGQPATSATPSTAGSMFPFGCTGSTTTTTASQKPLFGFPTTSTSAPAQPSIFGGTTQTSTLSPFGFGTTGGLFGKK